MPYIEEQFFDEPERTRQFELTRLRSDGDGCGGCRLPTEEESDDGEPPVDPAQGMAAEDG